MGKEIQKSVMCESQLTSTPLFIASLAIRTARGAWTTEVKALCADGINARLKTHTHTVHESGWTR